MRVVKKILKNGIKLVIVPIPNISSLTLTVWVRTGSRYENKKVSGISHFLEHMVFKGSKSRPSAWEISSAVDAIGGEFNAATSKDWTNFYIKAGSGNLKIAFDVLSDMVLNPLLKEEEIEREKGTIIEEIRMYEDTPIYRIGDVFEELIFAGSSLGRDTTGDEKSVRGIKKSDFESYRKMHYYPENILITVSGAANVDEVVKLAEDYFSSLKQESKVKPGYHKFVSKQTKPEIKLHSKKKEQAHFILGFRGNSRGYKEKFVEAILAAILGGGMSSRLFLEIRERRGLAYAVKTGIDRYADTGYFSTYAGVDTQKIDQAISVMLEQHYGIYKSTNLQIANKELEKAKEYIKGHLALALEDTKEVNSLVGESELFLNKIETPEEIYKKIDKVTKDDVLAEAKKLFVPEKLNLAIIGPYEDEERFKKLLR